VDSRVDIEEATGRMNIVYLPRHWKKEKETL
jgi:iron compound ABC transporter, ATP-binding protein